LAVTGIHIGTSGWSYEDCKGPFYPTDLPSEDMLAYYAGRFSSVEINSTFYRLPEVRVLDHWLDIVPEGFVFSAKASRYITHLKKLKNPRDTLPPFLDRISRLGGRLGPILFQLPPRWGLDFSRLQAFLESLHKGTRGTATPSDSATRASSDGKPGVFWRGILGEGTQSLQGFASLHMHGLHDRVYDGDGYPVIEVGQFVHVQPSHGRCQEL
jgi:uncharacterized protein YecE (DUF72 family)